MPEPSERVVGTCAYCSGRVIFSTRHGDAACGCGATVITRRFLSGGKLRALVDRVAGAVGR
jgi:hypothetical protein